MTQKTRRLLVTHGPDLMLGLALVLLFCVQAFTTLSFKEHLSLEDAAESLRSPYWWQQRTVLNGITSNVGYYSTLALANSVFGYSVYMAKWVRLGLHFFSLVAVAYLLRRWMGAALALVPFLIAGLSPTWLYFNANQCVFGIDLQFAPLLVWLALAIPMGESRATMAGAFSLGALWIWAALSYPTALFYFPALFLLVAWRWWMHPGRNSTQVVKIALSFATGIMLPLAGVLLYAKNPQLLVYDSQVKAGMLRGGGGGLTRRPLVILDHYLTVLRDLFFRSDSYSFSLPRVEFSNWLSRFGLAAVLLASLFLGWHFLKGKSWRKLLEERDSALFFWLIFFALFLFNAPQAVATFPGVRRITGFLFAYYGLLAFVWYAIWRKPEATPRLVRVLLLLGLSAHILGHTRSLQQNITIASANPNVGISWLRQMPTLQGSLEYWEHYTRNGGVLRCESLDSMQCRYQEIYATIQAYRHWGGLGPHEVLAWDPVQKKVRALSLAIWEKNEWPRN